MPSSPSYIRNYKQENGGDSPARKKNRASNNRARRIMSKAGLAKKGDGKDVAHRDNNSKNNTRSNLKMQRASKNRSFARTKTGKMK
jgi:hypothetical protein|tara:strand:+ start:347 stop:604 length:258 start_codon:yes stop_codon:yes gene_type:complete